MNKVIVAHATTGSEGVGLVESGTVHLLRGCSGCTAVSPQEEKNAGFVHIPLAVYDEAPPLLGADLATTCLFFLVFHPFIGSCPRSECLSYWQLLLCVALCFAS
ncbi:hypothetical protein E2C01_081360 [Portunus trituberculatus]|uniref:Uncharacterized protein n=1 Tax=Portunus trituberculatus TaxID=210409 RepID=A0A5B7IWF8_PORTR|nr:hypothetical protein [Portunus trituberculatus]